MKNNFYLLIVLFFIFSCGNEEKDLGYDSVSHDIITNADKMDTVKTIVVQTDNLAAARLDSIQSENVASEKNKYSKDYKSVDQGVFGISTLVFIRDSIQQNPEDYLVSCLQKWSGNGAPGLIVLLGKTKSGIWSARGYSQDGSGEVSYWLVHSDSSGKEQEHLLLKEGEDVYLKTKTIKNKITEKFKTFFTDTDQIIPLEKSDFQIEKFRTSVLSVYDKEENVTHHWYFEYTNVMCWQVYSWGYMMDSGKRFDY